MFDEGDILLFALSAWKQTTWTAFKKAFDALHRMHAGNGSASVESIQFIRARTLRIFVALGHCDSDFSGTPQVVIAPPALIALPQLGLPRAVLCGSRSPTTISELQRLCREFAQNLRVMIQRQESKNAFVPARVEIQADNVDYLQRCAEAAQISYLSTPPAWLHVSVAGSTHEYLEQLNWVTQPEINWDREDFNPRRLAFYPAQINTNLRLSRYKDPVRLLWQYRLVKDTVSAPVNPDWGRYAVLNAEKRNVLLYAEADGSVAVPRGSPLPNTLARALTFCSGSVAKSLPAWAIRSDVGENIAFDVYRNVPPDVFRVVQAKLGQENKEQLLFNEDNP